MAKLSSSTSIRLGSAAKYCRGSSLVRAVIRLSKTARLGVRYDANSDKDSYSYSPQGRYTLWAMSR